MYVQQVASGYPNEGFMYVPHYTWLLLLIYLQIVAKNKVLNGKKEVFGLSLPWNWELCRFIKIGNGIALGHTISSSLSDLILFINEVIWNYFSDYLVWAFNEIGTHVDSSKFWDVIGNRFTLSHTFSISLHFQFFTQHTDLDFKFLGTNWSELLMKLEAHVSDSSKFELL
jgi:hypothetical protein